MSYEFMALQHRYPWCWWCGRMHTDRPGLWGGPFLVERAHIVNNPRREDVRAVVLLCSLCHRLQHGHDIIQVASEAVVQAPDSACYAVAQETVRPGQL